MFKKFQIFPQKVMILKAGKAIFARFSSICGDWPAKKGPYLSRGSGGGKNVQTNAVFTASVALCRNNFSLARAKSGPEFTSRSQRHHIF
jgi:hypothetical protein